MIPQSDEERRFVRRRLLIPTIIENRVFPEIPLAALSGDELT
jgi:hypothetical protein